MENIIPTVGVLIYRSDEVLLVKHKSGADHLTGIYGLPAGRLKNNETELEAAIRELKEETGLITSVESLYEISETYTAAIQRKDGFKNFSLKLFICKNYSGELRRSEETIPKWVKISNLEKLELLPNIFVAVKVGQKYK